MDEEELKQWLQLVYKTQEDEIDCDTLHDAIARFVEMQVSGVAAAEVLPLVQLHLDQCPPCHDLFEALRVIVQLEFEDRLDEIPSSVAEILGSPAGGKWGQPAA